jgi:hypothetical protein
VSKGLAKNKKSYIFHTNADYRTAKFIPSKQLKTMKSTFNLCIALFTLMALSGCDKFKDQRFSTTIPLVFEVDKAEGGELIVEMDEEITALLNEELYAVRENIKSYELVSIKYKIWEFWGVEQTTFNGSLGIGKKNSTMPGVQYAFSDLNIMEGDANPAQVTMTFSAQDIEKIQQYFMDTNGLSVFLNGSTSNAPIHFKLAIEVNIDAIAEVEK